LVRINACPQEHFADLGDTPPFVVSDFLEFAFKFRRNAERQRRVFWHGIDFKWCAQIFNNSLAIAYIVCKSMYVFVFYSHTGDSMPTAKKKVHATQIDEILTAASSIWPTQLSKTQIEQLREMIAQFGFSPLNGDLQLLSGRWYVTHSGLLRLAQKKRCSGISTETVSEFCNPAQDRWVVKATVFKSASSKGFVGYGDADPSNVSSLVRGAEMRVAETRAVNRALRKAYGIGLCSIEEIGGSSRPIDARNGLASNLQKHSKNNGDLPGNGQPLLRDRLCLLIRQHNLDAAQVKRYAAEFCHVQSLREASRDQIEGLINHLTSLAEQGSNTLLEQLEPHAEKNVQPTEAA
jgi:hypothetical protein